MWGKVGEIFDHLMTMKKIILGIISASFLLAPVAFIAAGLIIPLDAFAGEPPPGGAKIPNADFVATIGNIADWIFYILIGVAVLFIVIGGLEYATASGDPEKIKLAGQKILYALIGVVAASLAKGLVILVQYFPKAKTP